MPFPDAPYTRPPMRVLTIGSMYPPHHLGGYELIWRSAVEHLRGSGHDVRVLACDWRAAGVTEADDPDVHRELRWYWDDHEIRRPGWRARWRQEHENTRALERHLDAFAPDVVCWWSMGAMSLSLIETARRHAVPAVGIVGDDWLVYAPDVDAWVAGWRRLPWARGVAARLGGVPTRVDLDRAAHWLFISESLRTAVRSTGGAPADSSVVHPGVGPLFTQADERPWTGRLLYAGRLDPRKGIDVAIGSLASLSSATLTVDGGGERAEEDRLRALAAASGVADRVTFAGRSAREVLPRVFADHDAVLFPVTWPEPFGLVPLEAMAVGRPVVATGEGGSGEYLVDGENCLLVPAGDPDALATAVGRLAADPGLRARLRSGGLETAARMTEHGFNVAIERRLRHAHAGQ